MSSADHEDDAVSHRPRKVIYDAREQVQAARNEVWNELVSRGEVSLHARRQLATATVQYWDVLTEYSDAREEEWEESGVDHLQNWIGSTVEVEVEASGDTSATETRDRPALLAVDPQRLIDISKRLDKLANEFGFAASVSDSEHRTDIDDELMEEVKEWQKQHDLI